MYRVLVAAFCFIAFFISMGMFGILVSAIKKLTGKISQLLVVLEVGDRLELFENEMNIMKEQLKKGGGMPQPKPPKDGDEEDS